MKGLLMVSVTLFSGAGKMLKLPGMTIIKLVKKFENERDFWTYCCLMGRSQPERINEGLETELNISGY